MVQMQVPLPQERDVEPPADDEPIQVDVKLNLREPKDLELLKVKFF